MLTRNARNFGVSTGVAVAAFTLGVLDTSAEPPGCYAGRPAVLPAPLAYGTAYTMPGASSTYADPSTHTVYRRTYSSPAYEYDSARVVYTSRRRVFDGPVGFDTAYYAPPSATIYYASPRVIDVSAPYYYGHHRSYSYRSDHSYRPSHHRFSLGFSLHGGYGNHYRSYGHSRGHRRWGFSLGHGRGHHGRHGGFSFFYGR